MNYSSHITKIEEAMLNAKLPEGVEVYDFGVGNFVAPEPPTGEEEPYIKSHMVAVMRARKSTNDPIILTAFPFDLQFITVEELTAGLQLAAQQNLTQTTTNVIMRTREIQ